MAATQAESQQNEVNREQVLLDHPPDLNNSVLQNGTEKNGARGLVGSDNLVNIKTKLPGQNSHSIEMSQYRQEAGAGPPIHNSSGNGEQNTNSASVDNSKLNADGKPYPQNSEQSTGNDQNYGKGSDSGRNMQGYGSLGFPNRGNYHPDHHIGGNPVQNSAEGNLHQNHPFSQFSPHSMRQGFPSSKPMPGSPMVPPSRPPSGGPNFSPHNQQQQQQQQQRFISGQSISQPTGPTPTLNQLLQSSNPVHRYQNSYGEFAMQKGEPQGAYNQSWPPQRPLASYSPQQPTPGYRNQPPGPRGQQQGPPYGGGYPPPPPSQQQQQQQGPGGNNQHQQYPPYPQRYSTPPGPSSGQSPAGRGQPFSPHQLNTPYGQQQQQQQQQQQGGGSGPPVPPPPVGSGGGGGPGQQQYEQRTAWGPSVPPSPGQQQQQQSPAPTVPPVPPQSPQQPSPQQPSPQPQHPPPSPGHSPHPPSQQQQQQQQQQQHMQQSHPQQTQGFPSRPQQASTPNAHAPEAGDLTGQNSNDSSSGLGPAPGTPGMRPTPSPTGSTGSRSMSPAVGQQNIPMPPHPSSVGGSGQPDGNTRMSHSPMAYQQPLAPPSHMQHQGYKLGPQQMSPYPPQPQQYPPQGNYNPRPQGQYGPNQGYGPAPTGPPGPQPGPQPGQQVNNMGQYPNRPLPNHVPHSQFGGYQGWAPTSGGKGAPPPPNVPPQPPNSPGQGPRPHTPPNYLKQHLQHKMFGNVPPNASPYGPGNGPNGPPGNMHHMASPMGPPPSGHHHPGMGPPPMSMGPPGPPSAAPVGAPPPPPAMANSHHESPMPPPANSHQTPPHGHADINEPSHDGDGPGGPLPSGGQAGVTSVVTTGPDGAPLDEGSQQSTLSNASAASGEDPSCTPKSRKDYHSHPATPLSTVPSPGAASINSMQEEYGDVNSPSWPRTPASPVFNSHVHQDPYRSKKPDSLCKLYEMDESHERRMWLDKLLQYMEERGTPISACPTISKNPLDLFRLYLYVKERGGFMEVCKVTKNKTWKDIAGLLGIGASSSAAYTLRKHYTKNLLAYECMFDRGGIDPQPIINQVEATSKKKGPKAASVPSPGSSNSQDSFPAAGSSGASMDGYGYGGYPPGTTPDYNSPPMQRPASQTGAPSPHPGMQQGYPQGQGGSGYPQYPDQYGRGGPGQEYGQQYPPGQYPPNRPMYPPYGGEGDRPPYSQGPGGAAAANIQGPDPYNRYPMGPGQQPPGYPARTGYGVPPGPTPPAGPPNAQPSGYPGQQEYYRPEQQPPPSQQQGYPGQQPPAAGGPGYGVGPPSKSMPPPAPQPRRHPDFANKEQQQQQQQQPPFPVYGPQPGPQQRPNMYAGWNNNQYRQQYPPQGPGPQGPQQWNQGPIRASGNQPVNSQWDQHRYSAGQQPPYQPGQQPGPQQWPPNLAAGPGSGPNSSLRPQMGPRQAFRPDGKQFGPMQAPGMKGNMSSTSPYPQQSAAKREINFPMDSVESTVPILYKRKRMSRNDVAPVEAWRLMMSLRSGLLAESCWALDVLNILLFDDTSVAYFGLAHLPGLLDVLLEHFRKSLANMFDTLPTVHADGKWYGVVKEEQDDVDLGSVVLPIDQDDRVPVLGSTASNYTLLTRKGEAIRVVNKDGDIFIMDSHKVWDVEGEVTERSMTAMVDQDPWQLTSADNVSTKYIVTCFQGEFGNVPFVRLLASGKASAEHKVEEEILDTSLRLLAAKTEPGDSEKSHVIVNKEDIVCKELVIGVERKNCEKKKRTKTLSDVLSRIKKEPVEVNDVLTREIREKVEQNDLVLKLEREDDKSSQEKVAVCNDKTISAETEPVVVLPTEKEVQDTNSICSNEIDKPELIETDKVKQVEDALKLLIKDPAGTLKRRRISDYEDECYARDEASLYLVTETQDSLARRCICLSNILRNLTFVPGNEMEFAKNAMFLSLLGKLLLLHHEHPVRTHKQRNYDREEDADFADSCSSLQGEGEWWWEFLHQIRENVLVTAANIAGHMDLSQHPEEISRPVLDGLLHWAVCPAAHGQDPFPTVGSSSPLSPQRLALEALCKLCVTDSNVDLVIATPPYSRLERLCAVLTKFLSRSEEQVLREFAVNLLHYLAAADSGVARTVALQSPCVSLLVAFVEQAEASALGVANQHGIGALRDNPDSMGTSLDMLRRAAGTLLHLARHPDNRPLFLQQEQRLLALVMSQILDQQVASIISRVLFQCSRPHPEVPHRIAS